MKDSYSPGAYQILFTRNNIYFNELRKNTIEKVKPKCSIAL